MHDEIPRQKSLLSLNFNFVSPAKAAFIEKTTKTHTSFALKKRKEKQGEQGRVRPEAAEEKS